MKPAAIKHKVCYELCKADYGNLSKQKRKYVLGGKFINLP